MDLADIRKYHVKSKIGNQILFWFSVRMQNKIEISLLLLSFVTWCVTIYFVDMFPYTLFAFGVDVLPYTLFTLNLITHYVNWSKSIYIIRLSAYLFLRFYI